MLVCDKCRAPHTRREPVATFHVRIALKGHGEKNTLPDDIENPDLCGTCHVALRDRIADFLKNQARPISRASGPAGFDES